MGVITGYKAPELVNPYKGAIDELIAAGDGAAYELLVPTVKQEGVKGGSAETHKARFQDAAREAGYSAKAVESEAITEGENEGKTRLVFVLKPRRTRKQSEPKPDAKQAKAGK